MKARERFAAALEHARSRSFGETCVRSVSLVRNDWSMTDEILETIKRYRLTRTGAHSDWRDRKHY